MHRKSRRRSEDSHNSKWESPEIVESKELLNEQLNNMLNDQTNENYTNTHQDGHIEDSDQGDPEFNAGKTDSQYIEDVNNYMLEHQLVEYCDEIIDKYKNEVEFPNEDKQELLNRLVAILIIKEFALKENKKDNVETEQIDTNTQLSNTIQDEQIGDSDKTELDFEKEQINSQYIDEDDNNVGNDNEIQEQQCEENSKEIWLDRCNYKKKKKCEHDDDKKSCKDNKDKEHQEQDQKQEKEQEQGQDQEQGQEQEQDQEQGQEQEQDQDDNNDLFEQLKESDIRDILKNFTKAEIIKIFNILKENNIVDLFNQIQGSTVGSAINNLAGSTVGSATNNFPSINAGGVIKHCKGNDCNSICDNDVETELLIRILGLLINKKYGLREIKEEVKHTESMVEIIKSAIFNPCIGLPEIKKEIKKIEATLFSPYFGLFEIKKEMKHIETLVGGIETIVGAIETMMSGIPTVPFGEIATQVAVIDTNVASIETILGVIENSLFEVKNQVAVIDTNVAAIETKISVLPTPSTTGKVTTGPVSLDNEVNNIQVQVLNNNDVAVGPITVIVYNLTVSPKTNFFTQTFIIPANSSMMIDIPNPPNLYEVQIQGLVQDVFGYVVSRSGTSGTISSANTYKSVEFVTTSDITIP